MKKKKLEEQSVIINENFHKIWFSIMFSREEVLDQGAKKLSIIEMKIIALAYENPDIILREIRDQLKIPQTTLSSTIAKLEKMDLVKRVINPRDMRSFSLKITKYGKKMIEAHYKKDMEAAKKVMISLEESERDEFIRLLKKIATNF